MKELYRPHRYFPRARRQRHRRDNKAFYPDQFTAPSSALPPTANTRPIHAGDGPGGYSPCPDSPEKIDIPRPVKSNHVKAALIRATYTPTDNVTPVILRNTRDRTSSASLPQLLEPFYPFSGIQNSCAVASSIRGHDTEAPPPRKKRYPPSITPFTHEPHTFHRFIRHT